MMNSPISVLRLLAAGIVGLGPLAVAAEPIPSASEVGMPAFPDALFTGVTRPSSGQINGKSYEILASVFLLTTAEADDVVALLFERPGALPVVEIVEVWSDRDRALLPEARTSIRLYHSPAPAP